MTGNGWKSMAILELLDMAGDGWRWLEIAGMAGYGWKWLDMA